MVKEDEETAHEAAGNASAPRDLTWEAAAEAAAECPVCLLPLLGAPKKACSPCGHVICAACADTNEIKRCPICRGSVEIFLRLFGP